MTELEHAIKHIKTRADAWAVKEVTEALRSISERLEKALSQEPCEDAEQIDYYDDFVTALKKISDYKRIKDMTDEEVYKRFVEPHHKFNKSEPCDDAISRQAVLNLIEKGECLSNGAVKKLPSVNPQPCDDAISRDAVYSILKEYHIDEEEIESAMDDCQNLTVNAITSDVSLLPSVTQKSGKWIDIPFSHYFKCSECDKYQISATNYCPICGAKMESEDKE